MQLDTFIVFFFLKVYFYSLMLAVNFFKYFGGQVEHHML